jgi:putative zinc finger/helix-turn-helix YgiT family protein
MKMKSPITGKEMPLKFESRPLDFRKESFVVAYHFYLCEESDEQFTTTDIDDLNMAQLYNQYREKHNLPFPGEIKEIREKYGLPATKMSEILGFGINSYRNYEAGEVPSLANARLIQLASDPVKFNDLVELSENIDLEYKKKLQRRIAQLVEEQEDNMFSFEFQDYLLGENVSDRYSGYKKPDLAKLTEMVIFFSEKLEPWKTQLNKLLFYADFLMFKRSCYSMSGTRYRAINMGPVPNNYNSIFEYMVNNDDVDIDVTPFSDGVGEQFRARSDRRFNGEVFTDTELNILETVAERFKGVSTKKIIDYSHQEKAWIENEKGRNMISYKDYAFDLSI